MTTGQTIGTSFSVRGPTTAGEKEDQLLEHTELPARAVLGGLYVAEGIDGPPAAPATPRWPPPGARVNPPRGTFCVLRSGARWWIRYADRE